MKPTELLESILGDGPTIKVLLVEDDEVDALRVERILSKGGEFELQRLSSMVNLVNDVSNNDIDVILLDLGLAGRSTTAVIPLLHSLTLAPIVVLSGIDPESHTVSKSISDGAHSFISKSDDLETDLVHAIHAAIGDVA